MPSPRLKSILLVTGLTAAAIALASGCAETSIDVGTLLDDAAAPPPPSFIEPDAGKDAEAGPLGPRALCIATSCPDPYATCGVGDQCSTNLSNDPKNCGVCGKVVNVVGNHTVNGVR